MQRWLAQYEDGYGVCYGIQEDSLKFSITCNNGCKDTSSDGMREALAASLIDLQRVLASRNIIYLGAPSSRSKDETPSGESSGKTTSDGAERTSKL
jgi:hypothetical protein